MRMTGITSQHILQINIPYCVLSDSTKQLQQVQLENIMRVESKT